MTKSSDFAGRAGGILEGALVELVKGIAEGREDALQDLYAATHDRVHGLALRMLSDPARAEEVTVEVYTRVWRRAAAFDPVRGRVSAWIGAMTRSACLDLLRAGGRRFREVTDLEDLEPWDEVPSENPDPGQALQRSESATRLRDALLSLPAEQERALKAAFFQGLTYREVAEALGQPLGTIKTRIRLGLAHLRQALGHGEEEFA